MKFCSGVSAETYNFEVILKSPVLRLRSTNDVEYRNMYRDEHIIYVIVCDCFFLFQYKYLPAHYTAGGDQYCIDTDNSKYKNTLKYYPVYSRTGCLLECRRDFIVAKCGCRAVTDPGWYIVKCWCRDLLDPSLYIGKCGCHVVTHSGLLFEKCECRVISNEGSYIEKCGCQVVTDQTKFVHLEMRMSNRNEPRKSLKIQKGNQNPSIEEGQTPQWPKEKGQTTIYKT